MNMNLEDRMYATRNGGEEMPKGMLFFYSVLFKHTWLGYTSAHRDGVCFSEKQVWLAAINRLKIALHAFEVETTERF